MKKYIAAAIIGLLSVSAVFGDTDIDKEDFLFLTPENRVLYPELDYKANPAILCELEQNLMLTNLDITSSYADSLKTRIDDSVGLKGGTEKLSSFSLLPGGEVTMFFPIDKKSLFGFSVFYNSRHSIDRADYLNFNGPAENKKMLTDENDYCAGTDFYLALEAPDSLDLGFSLGYNIDIDPAVFKWITDSTISPALHYTEPLIEPDNVNDFTHGLNAAAGMTFPADGAKFLVGVVYKGTYKDSTDEWVEVDTNGDGYKDTLYNLSDYYALPAASGDSLDDVTGHSFVDYTLRNSVDLNASIFWNIDKTVTMLAGGGYSILDYTFNHYAKNVKTGKILSDVSYIDKIYDSGLGTFDVNIAFDFEDKENKSSFRIGAGYSRYMENYSQNGDTIAGLMLYSSQNTGHYTELSLGTEPINNALVDAALYPAEHEIHEIMLNAGWRWIPEKVVTIFFDLGISAFHDTKTYRAFNLDTRTVWEEKDIAASLSWLIIPTAGVSFPLGKDLNCTIDLQNVSTVGDVSLTDESHLYDISLDRVSTNGTSYLLDNNAMDLKLDLTFQWSW